MRGDKRRGRGAAPAAIEAYSRVQSPSLATVALEGKTYTVTPAAVDVYAGVIAGEMTDMQVVQRVEKSSGPTVSPPRLVGTLRLRSSSQTHSVRLVVAKIQYLDGHGRPMKLEGSLTQEAFRLTRYGSEWLDPGQETIHAVDVAFPAEALTARKLTRLRLEIGYVSSPYREEMFNFVVSIRSQ